MLVMGPTATEKATPTPRFRAGIEHTGNGLFERFNATPTSRVIGDRAGYGSLDAAMQAATMLTVGARIPAAGIFELDGRFHARQMKTDVKFASGAEWQGPWKLEQYPSDLDIFDGTVKGITTRSDALRAVVDGGVHLMLDHIPAR